MQERAFTEASFNDLAAALSDSVTSIVYQAGASIIREDEPPGHAYLIERGQVKITRAQDADQKVVAILGPGELLGEMSPIDNQRRSASAIALTETEVIPISREHLEHAIDQADPLVQLLLRLLIERLRNYTNDKDANSRDDNFLLSDKEVDLQSIEIVRGRALRHLKQETELRDAFARREFDLYFQPIVRLNDGQVAGFEGLIRWLSPERGVVTPEQFIGLAESSGLIVPIGLWVLEHSCHMWERFQSVHRRHRPSAPPLFISANVSARQMRSIEDVDSIISTIRKSGIDPTALKIEITEGLLLDDPERAITAFNRLKALGVSIALDDFGTGYSSLSYLHRFPLDTLKIDRSFIMSMLKSHESMTVVKTITRLARDLKLNCVSEGIEDVTELTTLRDMRCEFGQGYLFSRPLPASEAEKLITDEKPWDFAQSTTFDNSADH